MIYFIFKVKLGLHHPLCRAVGKPPTTARYVQYHLSGDAGVFNNTNMHIGRKVTL